MFLHITCQIVLRRKENTADWIILFPNEQFENKYTITFFVFETKFNSIF